MRIGCIVDHLIWIVWWSCSVCFDWFGLSCFVCHVDWKIQACQWTFCTDHIPAAEHCLRGVVELLRQRWKDTQTQRAFSWYSWTIRKPASQNLVPNYGWAIEFSWKNVGSQNHFHFFFFLCKQSAVCMSPEPSGSSSLKFALISDKWDQVICIFY